jgi:hypothetical protein
MGPTPQKLVAYVNDNYAEDYIFVYLDWGIYYTQILYGHESSVPYWLVDHNDLSRFEGIMKYVARKPMFFLKSDFRRVHDLRKQYPNLVELKIPFVDGTWRAFYVP